jgi:hypothetical protein
MLSSHERLRVPEARSINFAEILTARTDTAAEVFEVSAAEAAAEAAAAMEAAAATEASATAGAPQKPPPMRLARERPWRPSCRKSLAAARTIWPRTPRRSSVAHV